MADHRIYMHNVYKVFRHLKNKKAKLNLVDSKNYVGEASQGIAPRSDENEQKSFTGLTVGHPTSH